MTMTTQRTAPSCRNRLPPGRVACAGSAAGHPGERLSNELRVVAQEVADLADELLLVHPRVGVARARHLELAG